MMNYMEIKNILIISIIIATMSCKSNSTNSSKKENSNLTETIENDNVAFMIEHMNRFHDACEGKSIMFRASGERTAITDWDNKYPKADVDEAIKVLKPTLLTDSEISEETNLFI